LILNFKKPNSKRNTTQWPYKLKAIQQAAAIFSENFGATARRVTFVPVPPSKLKGDPDYDDRMMDMLRQFGAILGMSLDVREMVLQTTAMEASHEATNRRPPSDWEGAYTIDSGKILPQPEWIAIVDDLLVTGCRFRAISNKLREIFPSTRITGFFIARRVPVAADFSDFFSEIDV
jgi:predicted amidophosphoribosyltransferase